MPTLDDASLTSLPSQVQPSPHQPPPLPPPPPPPQQQQPPQQSPPPRPEPREPLAPPSPLHATRPPQPQHVSIPKSSDKKSETSTKIKVKIEDALTEDIDMIRVRYWEKSTQVEAEHGERQLGAPLPVHVDPQEEKHVPVRGTSAVQLIEIAGLKPSTIYILEVEFHSKDSDTWSLPGGTKVQSTLKRLMKKTSCAEWQPREMPDSRTVWDGFYGNTPDDVMSQTVPVSKAPCLFRDAGVPHAKRVEMLTRDYKPQDVEAVKWHQAHIVAHERCGTEMDIPANLIPTVCCPFQQARS